MFLSTIIEDMNCEVTTYYQWVNEFYNDNFYHGAPTLGPWKYNWERIQADIKNFTPIYDHIIIDEAQDFPVDLIRILKKLSKNITCFIDPNQAIVQGITKPMDALVNLCVESPYILKRNFRNTIEIQNFSALFCSEGKPAEAVIPGNKPVMIHCANHNDQMKEMCRIIFQNKEKNIAVVVMRKDVEEIYENLLNTLPADIDINYYIDPDNNNINFKANGVKVISYGTTKGLEFDIVLLPRFDEVNIVGGGEILLNNRIYVATSRALTHLYLLYCTNKKMFKNTQKMFNRITNNPDLWD